MKYLFVYLSERLSTEAFIDEYEDDDEAMEGAEYTECMAIPLDVVKEALGIKISDTSKIDVRCYDSLREIRVLALNTTGEEWVALKHTVKRVLGVVDEPYR